MALTDIERAAVEILRNNGLVSRQVAAPLIAEHRRNIKSGMPRVLAENTLIDRVEWIVEAYKDIDGEMGRA